MTYKEKLQDPRWNDVRRAVLMRDGFKCKFCKVSNCQLHVHHRFYLKGKNPWDVPIRFLITLCDDCHVKVHKGRSTNSFVKNSINDFNRLPLAATLKIMTAKTIKKKSPVRKMKWVEGKGLVPIKSPDF